MGNCKSTTKVDANDNSINININMNMNNKEDDCEYGLLYRLGRKRRGRGKANLARFHSKCLATAAAAAKPIKPPVPQNITVTLTVPAAVQDHHHQSPTEQTADSATGSDVDDEDMAHIDDDVDVVSYSSLSSGLSLKTDDCNELQLSFSPPATKMNQPQIVYDLSGNGPWNTSN